MHEGRLVQRHLCKPAAKALSTFTSVLSTYDTYIRSRPTAAACVLRRFLTLDDHMNCVLVSLMLHAPAKMYPNNGRSFKMYTLMLSPQVDLCCPAHPSTTCFLLLTPLPDLCSPSSLCALDFKQYVASHNPAQSCVLLCNAATYECEGVVSEQKQPRQLSLKKKKSL